MLTLSPTTLFGANRKRNLFAHVVEVLGSRIIRGDLKPGDAIPNEADLGREFTASRSVIREAVKSLAAKGLIESRTRTGIRVLPPGEWNLLDIDVLGWRYAAMEPRAFYRELFEIRRVIEPEAAALAAERATPEDVERIARAYAVMAEAEADQTTNEAIMADLDFHRAILAAAHNDLLLQMGKVIGVGLLVSYRLSLDQYTLFVGRHEEVLVAIRRRRPQAARKMMERLLAETRGYLDTRIADGPVTARRR
ncbi:MAG: FadR family transcriptional regulator [Rhizobiales bacterium]|nr:FadR family transcriptional regulator [Hyphomicrobiales bacterium]